MSADRIESAVQRIETALARIAKAADSAPASPSAVSALVVKHEALRETASNTLLQLDNLIEELEK
ncbi:hypothetical protein [Pontixanthobacter luteolus]|uniref:hypothetical protein n=1 Tax=Pontixanthobacter luteolus TaxID=295089 RepID=UPI0023024C5C|nr:hypothetical protein [Pontixanthobacter luteolus]